MSIAELKEVVPIFHRIPDIILEKSIADSKNIQKHSQLSDLSECVHNNLRNILANLIIARLVILDSSGDILHIYPNEKAMRMYGIQEHSGLFYYNEGRSKPYKNALMALCDALRSAKSSVETTHFIFDQDEMAHAIEQQRKYLEQEQFKPKSERRYVKKKKNPTR